MSRRRRGSRRGRALLPTLLAVAPVAAAELEEIVVLGVPTSGALDAARVPAMVRSFDAAALLPPGTVALHESLLRHLGGATAFDSLGNPLQAGVALRGFSAAPALGEPQGIVLYQGPMRANEAFGDVVQWDLVPVFAVARAQVVAGSNPVFGPNSIGGAVALDMKDGRGRARPAAEVSVGSWGRRGARVEAGAQGAAWAGYAGVDAHREDGWRDHTPSEVARAYADLSRRSERGEVGLGVTLARSRLHGNGPAPEDLLAERHAGVFTHPDRTHSDLVGAALRFAVQPGTRLDVRGGAYVRRLARDTANGDRAEFEPCDEFTRPPTAPWPDGALCYGDEAGRTPAELLLDDAGAPLVGWDEIEAVFNRTRTRTDSGGGSAQGTWRRAVRHGESVFTLGIAFDAARTTYASSTEVADLAPDRRVESLGLALGNDDFNVGLRSRSDAWSVYASETYPLRPQLDLTVALRWNSTRLALDDRLGTDLDGDHAYSRVNAGVGLTWRPRDGLKLYASHARNNRIPTPAELSCADPERPCRFPNAFLADPPLDDVVARTLEVGGSQGLQLGSWEAEWGVSAYDTQLRDDIVFIAAGTLVGTGYFDNVRATRRRGLEAHVETAGPRGSLRAAYGFVDARFGTALAMLAPHNPGADASGRIPVNPGDRLPGIPRHSFKAGADWRLGPSLTVGTEVLYESSRTLRGDEANLQAPLPGYVRVDAGFGYRLGRVELFGRVTNLLDRRYSTFGIYGDAAELGYVSARFSSPAAPRGVALGLRASF